MEVEKSNERKRIEELAERTASPLVAETIQGHVAQVIQRLLLSVKGEIHKSALESLLLYRGEVARARDREWARVMAAVWPKHNLDAELPESPYEMQALILAWQQERERKLEKDSLATGLDKGFHRGVQEGVKFGYGASEAGKSLEEALEAAKSFKLTL